MHQKLSVANIRQTQQPGGFWLLTLELEEPTSVPGVVFYFEDHAEISLTLFQTQSNKLQLLSMKALPDEWLASTQTALLVSEEPTITLPIETRSDQATLLLGSDLGIAPLLMQARLKIRTQDEKPYLALLHATAGFPFVIKPAQYMLPELPPEAIGSCPLLEDWNIPNRLASDLGLPGCIDGGLEELFKIWLESEKRLREATEESMPHKITHLNWQIIAFLTQEQLSACKVLCQPYDWVSFNGVTVASV